MLEAITNRTMVVYELLTDPNIATQSIAIAALCCGVVRICTAQPALHELNQDQAREIVSAYLRDKGTPVESKQFEIDIEPSEPDKQQYFLLSVYYDADAKLNSLGSYAVNRRTAALWDRLTCNELKSEGAIGNRKKLGQTYHSRQGLAPPAWVCFH